MAADTRERCSYVWERRTPGKRYVNARGRCSRNATASDGRCAEHCTGDIAPGVRCEHEARRRRRYPWSMYASRYHD